MLEVTVFLLIITVLLTMLIPNYIGRINHAKYEKTVNELTSIAQASMEYFISEGSWPTAIDQLIPRFIPQNIITSPFGTEYMISSLNYTVTASVLIPFGIAQKNPQGQLLVINNQGDQDQIEITKTVQNKFISRLNYDLKYVY